MNVCMKNYFATENRMKKLFILYFFRMLVTLKFSLEYIFLSQFVTY